MEKCDWQRHVATIDAHDTTRLCKCVRAVNCGAYLSADALY